MVAKKKETDLVRTAGVLVVRGYRTLYKVALNKLDRTAKEDTLKMISRTIKESKKKGFVA